MSRSEHTNVRNLGGLAELAEFLRSVTTTTITSLPSETLRVIKPIPAEVEKLGPSNFLSRAPAVECYMSGDTVEEAIDNLKDIIVSSFEHYDSMPAEKLGVGPTKALAAMRQHIEKIKGNTYA